MKGRRRYHEIKVFCAALVLFCAVYGNGESFSSYGPKGTHANADGAGESAEKGAEAKPAEKGAKAKPAERGAETKPAKKGAEAKPAESGRVTEPPRLAITFDDGPSSICTGRLLDGLKERQIKATFFLIGKYAEQNPELVKRIYEEGHLIGNHTYHHVDISRMSDEDAEEEIKKTDEVIYAVTSQHVKYIRPPFGAWRKGLELEMEVLPVMWSVDPLDWTTENVDEIVNKVVTEAEEDDIILLHDCYDSSVDAALRIVDILTKEGYEFVTVDELIMD